jgi:hypothetical protein
MKQGRKLNVKHKDAFIGIRTTTEVAETIRTLAFMKGETLSDWIERKVAAELADPVIARRVSQIVNDRKSTLPAD